MITPREREVAILAGKGKTNPLIARELGITEKTVEAHMRNISEKLDAQGRLSVVIKLLVANIITLQEVEH
jgi:DNA-binding CsgD family transcriptional regulator